MCVCMLNQSEVLLPVHKKFDQGKKLVEIILYTLISYSITFSGLLELPDSACRQYEFYYIN